jgi:hypothetical protein
MVLIGIFTVVFKPHLMQSNYQFTHWGLEITTATNEDSIPWRQFQKMQETRSFIFLVIMRNKVNILIPFQKRKFSGEADLAEFKEFITHHLP